MGFDRGEVAVGKQILQGLGAGVAQLAAKAKVAPFTPTDQRHPPHRFRVVAESAARLSSAGRVDAPAASVSGERGGRSHGVATALLPYSVARSTWPCRQV